MTDTETTGAAPEQEPLKLTGYCMKRKQMTTLLGSAKALACIEAGLAKKGWED